MALYLGLPHNLSPSPVSPVGPQPFPGIGGGASQTPSTSVFSNPSTNTDPNYMPSEAVRNTNQGSQFDPQYMQNMATYIGGLFSRPQGQLGFNPLGDLSEISPPSGFGNAPLPGLPPTLLNSALSGFPFASSTPATATATGIGGVSDTGAPASAASGFPDMGFGVLGGLNAAQGGLAPPFFGSGFNPDNLYDPFGVRKAFF